MRGYRNFPLDGRHSRRNLVSMTEAKITPDAIRAMKGKQPIPALTAYDFPLTRLLDEAGAFAIVLELVTPPVAAELSRSIQIPTIGIGSGPDCDGQILVTLDLIGGFPWFTPRFVKPKIATGAEIKKAVGEWMQELRGIC